MMAMHTQKILHKASAWSGSGRRRGVFGLSQQINRELRRKKREPEMFASMQELMRAYRRKR